MNDDGYDYWQAKLRGEDPDPLRDRSKLPLGFWRLRSGDPLAVWLNGSERVALRGFKGTERVAGRTYMESMAESGSFGQAVTEDAYRAAFDTGRWPDTDPVVAAQTGRNDVGVDDAETLRDQIEAALAGAKDYAEIADDETAARAQSLRSRLNELAGEADKKREAEKKPHFEAGKAVDAKWQPIVKAAKGAADAIRSALGAWETAKLRREQEAARKAQPAPSSASATPTPISAAPAKIKGGYGRTANVKTVAVAKIVDQDACYRHFRERPEVGGVLATLAQKAIDAGGAVPGVTTEQERRVS